MSCWRTRVGSALSRSTLVTATTIGTSAARAWLIASMVCGITPSSAATTSTAMSVTCAPRARMAVNASWPGVSMNVIERGPVGRVARDAVRTDALRDAAGFTGHDVRVADRVEQRRLAVVDVTEHRDDRRARLEQRVVFLVVFAQHREELDLLLAPRLDQQHGGAERLRDQLDHLVGERHGRGDHLARLEEDLHEVGGRAVELGRELLDGDAARDDDLAFGDGRIHRREPLRRGLELGTVATALLAPALGRAAGSSATRRSAVSPAGTAAGTAAPTTGTARGHRGRHSAHRRRAARLAPKPPPPPGPRPPKPPRGRTTGTTRTRRAAGAGRTTDRAAGRRGALARRRRDRTTGLRDRTRRRCSERLRRSRPTRPRAGRLVTACR